MTSSSLKDKVEPHTDALAVISIGSNCGDRINQVSAGIDWLKRILHMISVSSIYNTEDCHGGNREYLNAVVAGLTDISPTELDQLCKRYELDHGRTPEARAQGDVPVDIDVVKYDNEILRPKDYRQRFFQKGYQELFPDK